MRQIIRALSKVAIVVLATTAAVVPAQAAVSTSTQTIWSTTSKSKWVGIARDPKVALNGDVTAMAWLYRNSQDTAKLAVRVQRGSVLGNVEYIRDLPYNWYGGFDVQVTNSGTVYVGFSDMDTDLDVYTQTSSDPTWVNSHVDTRWSGQSKLQGTQQGNKVSFLAARDSNDGSQKNFVTSYSFDEADSVAGWVTKEVRQFTATDFSACTRKPRVYYDSCEVGIGSMQILNNPSGEQVAFFSVSRDSSNGAVAGLQHKVFKAHRSSATADWVSDVSIVTATARTGADGYAFFMYPAVVNQDGKYVLPVTTDRNSSKFNTVELYTANNFADAPTATDSPYMVSLKGTDNPALVVSGSDFFLAFEDSKTAKFGKVGSLSTTTRTIPRLADTATVKNLYNFDGKIYLIATTHKTGTFVMNYNGSAWSSVTKVSSYSDSVAPIPTPSAVFGTKLIILAPKLVENFRQTAFYAITLNVAP